MTKIGTAAPTVDRNSSSSVSSLFMKVIFYLILAFGAFLMFVPFYWMLMTSFKTGAKVLEIPPTWFPDPVTFEYYIRAWTEVNFARYSFNSLVITVLDILGVLLSCSMVAFGLAFFEFKTKKPIYLAIVSTIILPSQVTLIPTYFIWKNLNAFDTFYPLFVPSFFGGAFGIFLMHQFFKSLPKELFEAAIVDGYTPWGVLWRIYVPLSRPALTALAVFTFMGSWSSTLGPLLYITDKDLYTLPLGLLYLRSGLAVNETPLIMAGSVIVTTPVVILFLFAQKQFVQGIATAGLKG